MDSPLGGGGGKGLSTKKNKKKIDFCFEICIRSFDH